MDLYGVPIEARPKIVVMAEWEMPTCLGRYDAVTNTVFYIPEITNKSKVALLKDVELGSVEKHEMWHMKQAYEFSKRHGFVITDANYNEYIRLLCADCQKRIEEYGINAYNVSQISAYAKIEYFLERYDEVEAEFKVLGMKKG